MGLGPVCELRGGDALWLIIDVAKMGKSSDPNAVVDVHGKVFGVTGLRVVDASTFPLTPPGHIMATVCKFSY